MRKYAVLAALAAVLPGCGWFGMATNEAKNDPNTSGYVAEPTLYDNQYSYWDVAKLKEGDWVEYETSAAGTKSSSKLACVKLEGNLVWVETTSAGSTWVTLVAVDKTDRKLKKAYFGEKDKEAKEIKVQAAPAAAGGTTTNYKYKGKGKVSKDSVTAAGTAYDCEKVETTGTTTMDGKDYSSTSTQWFSDKVPFKYIWDESNQPKTNANYEFTWEGKPTYPGGLVKLTSEASGSKTEQVLVKCGTDAKMTVKIPAPK